MPPNADATLLPPVRDLSLESEAADDGPLSRRFDHDQHVAQRVVPRAPLQPPLRAPSPSSAASNERESVDVSDADDTQPLPAVRADAPRMAARVRRESNAFLKVR